MLLAHGVGGRQDLPIPFSFALAGALVALVVSFVALGALWREPRLGGDLRTARPLPSLVQRVTSAPAWPWCWRGVGLIAAAYFGLALLAGPDTADNPSAGTVYVLFWVGLVPLSLLLGPVWRALNPLRTVHLLACLALRRDPRSGLRPLPARLGYWPAAVGLFAFVWLELVAPDRATLPVLRIWLAGYALCMLAGAVAFGRGGSTGATRSRPTARLLRSAGTVVRRRDGVLVWRNSLDGMSRLRPAPGLSVLVVVMLGSTMYDSLAGAPLWVRFVQAVDRPVGVRHGGLVVTIAVVYAAFVAATALAGRWGGVTSVDSVGSGGAGSGGTGSAAPDRSALDRAALDRAALARAAWIGQRWLGRGGIGGAGSGGVDRAAWDR